MRERPLPMWRGVSALLLFTAACTSSSAETTGTTQVIPSGPAETTAAAAPAAPAGPGVMSYGLEPGQIIQYRVGFSTAFQTSRGFDILPGLVPGEAGEGSLEGSANIEYLILEGLEPDAVEVVSNVVFGEGHLTGVVNGEQLDDRLQLTETALLGSLGFGGLAMGTSVDARGGVVRLTTDFPSILRSGDIRVERPLGPPFPEEAVGEGDSWAVPRVPAVEGAPAFATITGADILDDRPVWVIELADAVTQAATISAGDRLSQLLADQPAAAAMGLTPARVKSYLQELDGVSGEVVVTTDRFVGDSTYWFDPEAGLVVRNEGSTEVVSSWLVTTEQGGTMESESSFQMDYTVELVGTRSASATELRRIVGVHLEDPNRLAFAPIDRLTGYDVEDVEESALDVIAERFADLRADLFAAVAPAVTSSLEDDDVDAGSAQVVSFLIDREFRGDPFLSVGVAIAIAGEEEAEIVSLENGVAYRIDLEEEPWPWYLWASNTHLFLVTAQPARAEALLDDLMSTERHAYLWQRGDCLGFADNPDGPLPHAPFGRWLIVPCGALHTHEVIHSEILPDGAEDPYPDIEIRERVDRACGRAFYDYVGALPRHTDVALTSYLPDAAEWEEGDRYLACILSLPSAAGTLRTEVPLRGAGPDHPRSLETGVCISELALYVVSCDQPHQAEIVGRATHPGDDEPYPGIEAMAEAAASACDDLLGAYGISEGEAEVQTRSVGLSAFEWDFGLRDFECFAVAVDEAGALVEVVGGFRGDWSLADPTAVSA